jgi:hypothetical protein
MLETVLAKRPYWGVEVRIKRAVTGARQKSWAWMALAFCATLGLSVTAVAIFYTPHKNLAIALMTSARLAFLFFWPAYVGGALTSLFGDIFLPLRQHGRDLGLAFAAALLVHLGFVAYLCGSGHPPPVRTFLVFGSAAILTYLLVLLSIDRVRQAIPPTLWPTIRAIAMNYIALAFILDFTKFSLSDFDEAVVYLPFAAFAILAPLLKLAAWMQNLRQAWVRRVG